MIGQWENKITYYEWDTVSKGKFVIAKSLFYIKQDDLMTFAAGNGKHINWITPSEFFFVFFFI